MELETATSFRYSIRQMSQVFGAPTVSGTGLASLFFTDPVGANSSWLLNY
jgi:hypothetical protein